MIHDEYLEYFELENIRKECGKKIVCFSGVRAKLKEWYQDFYLTYPDSCTNNFRDSWFHYRKIWKERSFRESTAQISNFDEHLQRAEKDAVVSFLQTIVVALEFWYLSKNIDIPGEYINDFNDTYSYLERAITLQDAEWLNDVWVKFEMDEKKASYALVFIFNRSMSDLNINRNDLQRLLHKTKNIILHVRMDSFEIYRMNMPGVYFDMCEQCYSELSDFFLKPALFYLFGITNVIKANIGMCQSV